MSRHRHVGRLVKGALEEYEDDDDDDEYYEDDDTANTYSRANQQPHSVAVFTSKPAKAKAAAAKPATAAAAAAKPTAALPPPHPTHAAHTAATASTAAHARTPSIPAGFNAGDYADDDYIPPDDEYEQWDEEGEEEWEAGEGDYGDSSVTYKQPAAAAPKPKQAAKATPKKGKPASASSVPARTPSPFTAATPPRPTPTPPPAARLRTAAEEADTAAAVDALRLEKLKLSNSPSMPRLSSASSTSIQTELPLSRSYSPAPSTPTSASSSVLPSSSPGTLILRTSSSTEQLAAIAHHKRQQSRLAVVEAEDKKETSKPTLNVVVIGHVDAGKCFARGTRVRLYDGDSIAVENVVAGMRLMGDDGQPRTVAHGSLTRGNDTLYRITPAKHAGSQPFTVNRQHILVLTMNVRPFYAVRSDMPGRFRVKWWELDTNNVMRLRQLTVGSEREAQAEVDILMGDWQPLEWEVSVEDFLRSTLAARTNSKLIASNAITFANPQLSSLHHVLTVSLGGGAPSPAQLEYMAWWLGMWVTDGSSDRARISQGGEPHPRPNNHKQIMDRLLDYRQLFNEPVTKVLDKVSTAGWSAYNFDYYAGSVADRVLRAYGLINNKHIPRALICDSLNVRRRLLAGLIDGEGWYCAGKKYYEISAKHSRVLTGYKELAATLGLRNSPVQPHTNKDQQTGEEYNGYRIIISGHMWDAVQYCVATYKRCPAPGTAGYVVPQKDSRCYGFRVIKLAAGDYFGFAVDGNQRFLLEDYTITHNSTLMGHLLLLMGVVSAKTLHKYEKDSRAMGKASFHFAWVLDQQDEERQRGITVDVAVSHFSTPTKHITLLDAPGHRDFIPNMIAGTAQADVAVLVVPAVVGEFEAGFVDEGQIREHAMLARSMGVGQLVVAVNKGDVVEWKEERYRQILAQLLPFLKSTGYKDKDITTVPVSGLTGENITERSDARLTSWYSGPTLLAAIDALTPPKRPIDRPFRCCVTEVFRSQTLGVTVAGRVDSGAVMKGDSVLVLPQGETVSVRGVEVNGDVVAVGRVGENVEIGLKDVTDPALLVPGSWLCDPHSPIPLTQRFRAQVLTTALSRVLMSGSSCIMYTQSAAEEVTLSQLVSVLDSRDGRVLQSKPRFLGRGVTAVVEVTCKRQVCIELYRDYRELGRFSLRRGTETVAVGIVQEIL